MSPTRAVWRATVHELAQGSNPCDAVYWRLGRWSTCRRRPLAREVDARWGCLFPERGDFTTYADGQITREVNGEALPYDSFSTGERMGALILLRLLVLETVTNAHFCWFDEPLEHLDPDARRQVGSLLARASTAGPLRQLVVTTYEERLARKLQERDPDNVRLLYVRQRVATSA